MMNFTPFGGHFPTAIPTIHQFAAKFSQENTSTSLCPTQENNSNRYTANGVPSFTQHHPPTQQQMINTTKYQTNYMNQAIYGHQNNVRQEKRQGYEHQELAQELCAAMLQQNQNQQQEKQNNDKVSLTNLHLTSSYICRATLIFTIFWDYYFLILETDLYNFIFPFSLLQGVVYGSGG